MSRLLVLSQVQDPGNVGTLIRSGLAFGFEAVLICGGADPFNARAVRSAAGAVFHMPVLRVDEHELDSFRFYHDLEMLIDLPAIFFTKLASKLAFFSISIYHLHHLIITIIYSFCLDILIPPV